MKIYLCTVLFFQNAVQPGWPSNRQMFVPSWQQLPAQRTFQQSVIPETESWGRPLVLERAALLPEQSAVIPVVGLAFHFVNFGTSSLLGSWHNLALKWCDSLPDIIADANIKRLSMKQFLILCDLFM